MIIHMAALTAEQILQPRPSTDVWDSLAPEGESAIDIPLARWDVPLGEWDTAFDNWIARGAEFRRFESKEFFADVDSPVLQRIHRGWLCNLISDGELLGVGLLKI